jgi:hypothetical protein
MKKQVLNRFSNKQGIGAFKVLTDSELNSILSSKSYNMQELLKTKYVIGLLFVPQYSNIFQNLVGAVSNNPAINKQISLAKQQRETARAVFASKGWNAGEFDITPENKQQFNFLKEKIAFVLIINMPKPQEKIAASGQPQKQNQKQLVAKYTAVVQTLLKSGYDNNVITDKVGMVSDAQWQQLSAADIVTMLSK